MYISGWAFNKKEKELQQKSFDRYREIKHLARELEIKKDPKYGHFKFTGVLKSEEAKALSETDLALIADHGNLCFGGTCIKRGDSFSGKVNTD